MKIVNKHPIGCMLGTKIRAIKPITMPAASPLSKLEISMLPANHYPPHTGKSNSQITKAKTYP
jgi:hypothetical protein